MEDDRTIQYVFCREMDFDLTDIDYHEGAALALMNEAAAMRTEIAYGCTDLLRRFFKSYFMGSYLRQLVDRAVFLWLDFIVLFDKEKGMRRGPAKIVSCFGGNTPVILSAHHDGWLTSLDGNELPVLRDVGNDEGTRRLVWLVFRLMKQMYGMRPYVLAHRIKKDRSSEEMLTAYVAEIFSLTRHCLEKWGLCYVFDVHRFYKHPEFTGEITQGYDIWLGTDHRASVRGDFDKKFAASLSLAFDGHCGQKLDIYVPDEKERIGERFGATGKHEGRRIVTKLISEEFRGQPINAIQVEFYKDLLAPDERIKSAVALSEAIVSNI